MNRQLHKFEQWLISLRDIQEQNSPTLDYDDYAKKNRQKVDTIGWEKLLEEFVAETIARIQDGPAPTVTFNIPGRSAVLVSNKTGLAKGLSFSGSANAVSLDGISVENLKLSYIQQEVRFQNLQIAHMHLTANVAQFTLENCWIGNLHLGKQAAKTWRMNGGCVLNIICATPEGQSPFDGSVFFGRDVYFPRNLTSYLEGPQAYRNMRAHMIKLENAPMANLFFTLEQATERKQERLGVHRIISWFYEKLSDYGSSMARPLAFFFGLFLLTVCLIAVSDGAVPPEPNELKGWQLELNGPKCFSQTLRAIVLSGQATLNPLGIFGVKGLLVAKHGWLAAWLVIHGLCSTLLAALIFLAVRRRFKMT